MIKELAAFGRISRMNFRMVYGWMQFHVYALTLIVRPATQVIFFAAIAHFAVGTSDVSFQLIGNSAQVSALASLYAVGDVLLTERRNGTLGLMMLSPRSKFFIFGGRVWLLGAHGAAVSAIALLIGSMFFPLDLGNARWGWFLASLAVTVLSTSCLGAAIGCLGLITRDINLISNIAAGLLLTMCGINFPISLLPGPVRLLSEALPMTRGVEAMRLAVYGVGGFNIGAMIGREAGVGLAWLVIGYAVFRWVEHKSRAWGSLDFF